MSLEVHSHRHDRTPADRPLVRGRSFVSTPGAGSRVSGDQRSRRSVDGLFESLEEAESRPVRSAQIRTKCHRGLESIVAGYLVEMTTDIG
jgi:hypothetical protein